MIIYALKNVPCVLTVEKGNWQFHQLNEKISKNRKINPGTDVQEYPTSYKLYNHTASKQGELG